MHMSVQESRRPDFLHGGLTGELMPQRVEAKFSRHMLQFGRCSAAEADGNLEIRRKSRCLGISRNTTVKFLEPEAHKPESYVAWAS